MAKQPKWKSEEKKELYKLLDEGKTYKEISEIIGRSENGIKIKISKWDYFPKCLDCGQRIINRKGNRLRCEFCSLKRTLEKRRNYHKTPAGILVYKKIRDFKRFGGLRKKVIKRDKGKCVNCGMTRDEHILKFGCDITINHKDGKGRNSKIQNHKIDNLETLCLTCHGKKDAVRRRKDWSMCGSKKGNNNRPKLVKYKCVKCGKWFRNNKKRYLEKGNYCDKCY